jgi:hypothetical protein
MALHRDIFWVGRQWAVTGSGMQAVDQKQKGKFDIEASRLWEDDLAERLRVEGWLNTEDFDKALDIARKQFPQQPQKAAPLRERVSPVKEKTASPVKEKSTPQAKEKSASKVKETPVEEPKAVPQKFSMRIESWPAKFLRPWRIRLRR